MRIIWLIFGSLLLLMVGLRFYWQPAPEPVAARTAPGLPVVLVAERTGRAARTPASSPRDSIVRFALQQVGTPYVYAGASPRTGFDCSGFLQYVYAHFGIDTPHATALLISAGLPVARTEAQPGDIVVFTGTAEGSTTPGHAGIVISALGETPLRFVHASSARRESGVKVSQVEGSGYERRFMQVRRVLGSTTSVTAPLARSPRGTAPSTVGTPPKAVAALAPKPATALATVPVAALPMKVVPLPTHTRPLAHAKKTVAKSAHSSATKAVTKRRYPAKATAFKPATKRKAVVKKLPATTRPKK